MSADKVMTIALVGNPNSGKTTVFNVLTKLRQKVGNYSGVTVEKKSGRMTLANGKKTDVIDLPGTYSLAVRSTDEKAVHDVLFGHMTGTERPDWIVCVLDATNLERNFYLVSQIHDLELPMVIVLNMMDELEAEGKAVDVEKLQAVLGIPVVPMVATKGKGVEALKEILSKETLPAHPRPWRMSEPMEEEVEGLVQWLMKNRNLDRPLAFSEAVIWISKGNIECEHIDADEQLYTLLTGAWERLSVKGVSWRMGAIEARYNWVHKILDGVVRRGSRRKRDMTQKLDAVLIHKVWGWFFFAALMAFMFLLIFTVATYPMDWIDAGFARLAEFVKNVMPAGDLRNLITDGVIAGVGGIVIFLPQILILFFFISLLQDTGYMARAAFIMDRLMNSVGLHGKSFIPLLSSFACAIPGVMSARSIESTKDRLVTILVAPLMTCSARLPVFTLLVAILLPSASVFGKTGIMMLLYALGILGAVVMAWVFKRTLLKGPTPPFIMELPPYRLPSVQSICLHMWERSRIFLKRAGTVIFAFSVVLWALMNYPKHEGVSAAVALEKSYAGQIGMLIEPVIKPLGYDWRIGIGLVGSFTAREIFVSTMSIVFNVGEGGGALTLREAFVRAQWPDGSPLFTPLVCVSLMVFFVYAMQCISSIAVVRRETNSWRWPIFQVVYMGVLAYTAAFLVYQGGRIIGLQ
ncbi:MAG: ferrous iron transport protein B [Candidatus Omnitrophica bacterium]|nr:ferrous iron transport protein B [Candidatus Omnitrophota bacterium]